MKSKCRMFEVLFYMVVMTKLRSTTFGIPIPTCNFRCPRNSGRVSVSPSTLIIIPLNPFICRKLPPEASFSAHTLAPYTNHSVPLRSHAPSERAMLRRARVPMPAARPQGGPLPKAKGAPAPGALRVLYRAAVDAVLYAFLAALWANNFLSTVLEILGRWVCGEGSSVEAAGLAVRACSKFVMVLLSPCYIQLVMMRVREHAELDLKEQEKERREKEEREKVSILTTTS